MNIKLLRNKIRYAIEPDQPQILSLWLAMEHEAVGDDTSLHWDMYKSQFELLLESASDELNNLNWRYWCLDNINRPLMNLQRLIQNEQDHKEFRALCETLRITSQYAFMKQA